MLVQPTVHGLVLRGVGYGSKCKLLFDVFELRPAGGVKHSDSDLVETGMLSAKKALR